MSLAHRGKVEALHAVARCLETVPKRIRRQALLVLDTMCGSRGVTVLHHERVKEELRRLSVTLRKTHE
jgi:hypothetical protein